MRTLSLFAIILLINTISIYSVKAQTNIYDIQYVEPSSNSDISPYINQTVTVRGVVTATKEPGNLGTFFIQQPNLLAWAGIQLDYSIALSAVEMGDIIEVTGKVIEDDGVTKISSITKVDIKGKGSIQPVSFNPDAFTNSSLAKTEQYEGMLVSLNNTTQPIYVVNSNPNAPLNNGEWRVGSSLNDVQSGCRILTGVQSSSISSSLNVSYVNHVQWVTNAGVLNVAPIIINNGNQFYNITGVMTYNSDNIVLLPRTNDDFTKSAIVTGLEDNLSFKKLNVYPNPMVTDAIIEFETNQVTTVSAEMYDLQGKFIQLLGHWTDLPVGSHKERIEPGDNVSSGNYLLKINCGSESRTLMVKVN